MDPYTTLGFLAAETNAIELQALVTGVTYLLSRTAGEARADRRTRVSRAGRRVV